MGFYGIYPLVIKNGWKIGTWERLGEHPICGPNPKALLVKLFHPFQSMFECHLCLQPCNISRLKTPLAANPPIEHLELAV